MIKSNGDGTWNIKTWLAILTLIILVVSPIVAAVYTNGKLTNDVENIKLQLDQVDENTIKLNEHNSILAVTAIQLEIIKEDVAEIKSDVKEILKNEGK